MSLHLDDGSRDNFAGQSHELTDLTGLLNRDVNDVQEPTPETETRSEQGASSTTKRFTGWRVGASYFALGALISLMLHIILAIWIPTLDSFHNGISVLWTGNCHCHLAHRWDYQVYMVSRDFWNSTNTVPVDVLPSIQTSYLDTELSIPRNATRYLDGIKTAQSRPGSVEQNDIGEFKRLMCWDTSPPPSAPSRLCFKSIPYIAKQPSGWAPSFLPVKYCHSEIVEENCALNANQPIVIVIIICNSIKLIIITTMVFWVKGWPIITLGDAIQSFLNDPDPTTEGLCLLSKDALTDKSPSWPKSEPTDDPDPVMAGRRRHRWSDADNNIVNPFSIGFGSVDAAAVVTYRSVPTSTKYRYRILAAVVVANLPQMIFSIIIFSLNNLLAVIYTAQEWEGFSRQRKTLRVSEPKGEQRSTYFLQLPYRIAVPFNVATGVISWLLSNSVFPLVIYSYDSLGRALKDVEVTACGFSPWPMVLAIAVGVVLIAGVCTFFFFRFVSTMPMVGTCSAAISAACHHDDGQEEVALKPVKWGAVFVPETEGQEWIGHCCFTSSLVKRPKPGRFYAGGGAAYRGK
ncbi:hypothetical protein MRS44_004208 [Fusarium solani]|uniref:uncharacterized protein n=1 Tax=Fusarium solani TaxID=169388 RepID=UPI0032C40508|nr:hypothetical protein MRS44_004208 [Fusarium solani]